MAFSPVTSPSSLLSRHPATKFPSLTQQVMLISSCRCLINASRKDRSLRSVESGLDPKLHYTWKTTHSKNLYSPSRLKQLMIWRNPALPGGHSRARQGSTSLGALTLTVQGWGGGTRTCPNLAAPHQRHLPVCSAQGPAMQTKEPREKVDSTYFKPSVFLIHLILRPLPTFLSSSVILVLLPIFL